MPKKGKPIIKLDCISKRYNRCGVVVIALADFSLKIHPGEFVSIISPLDVEDIRFYIVWGF